MGAGGAFVFFGSFALHGFLFEVCIIANMFRGVKDDVIIKIATKTHKKIPKTQCVCMVCGYSWRQALGLKRSVAMTFTGNSAKIP